MADPNPSSSSSRSDPILRRAQHLSTMAELLHPPPPSCSHPYLLHPVTPPDSTLPDSARPAPPRASTTSLLPSPLSHRETTTSDDDPTAFPPRDSDLFARSIIAAPPRSEPLALTLAVTITQSDPLNPASIPSSHGSNPRPLPSSPSSLIAQSRASPSAKSATANRCFPSVNSRSFRSITSV